MSPTRTLLWTTACWAALNGMAPLTAAPPTAEEALRLLKPVQADVPYDRPSAEDVAACRVEPLRGTGLSGWTVYGPSSQILRRFVDTNGDNRLDQWCYFQNGIEVYRDLDEDFNGKAEQYRWLGTAGARWGLDDNEDGVIDRWKSISPEEVTAEVVAALRDRDAARFGRVLLRAEELDQLGVGRQQREDLQRRIQQAEQGFAGFAGEQALVGSSSQWAHFGATRPGVLPAGTAGSTKDLVLYDHAAAIVETDGQHGQVIIGTLVRVGDGWRVIDLPRKEAAVGLFFAAVAGAAAQAGEESVGLNPEMQRLLAELEKLDQQLERTTQPAGLGQLNARRADLLEQIVTAATGHEDRGSWIRQFADTISAAAQAGDYPEGVQRLNTMLAQLEKERLDPTLLAFVRFRFLTAQYAQQIQKPDADFAKIQEQWLEQLELFVKDYPRAEDAPDAMLQLAVAQEFAGNESEAGRWYGRVVAEFPDSHLAAKAVGAKRRLESVGQSLTLSGRSLDGAAALDLARYRGRAVLIHYWATWCEPCKQDIQQIRALEAKYASQGFTPLGVSLDHERQVAADFVKAQRIGWPQMHEPGGLDSPLASQLGILTLPTMLLIDPDGRVVRRNIHAGELEEEIRKLLPQRR